MYILEVKVLNMETNINIIIEVSFLYYWQHFFISKRNKMFSFYIPFFYYANYFWLPITAKIVQQKHV